MRLADALRSVEAGIRPVGGVSETSGTIPSIGGENISPDGRMRYDGLKKIPRPFFVAMRRGNLAPGDVLVNKDGAQTGKVALYTGEFPEAAVNEHVFLLRGRPEVLNQRFLFRFLASEGAQRQLARVITGSAQPGLKSDFAQHVRLDLPTPTEQEKIADLLDRSALNLHTCEAVVEKLKLMRDGLAEALVSRGISSSGSPRSRDDLIKTTAIGRIAESWMMTPLGDVVRSDAPIGYGIVQPGPYFENGVPVLAIHNLAGRFFTNVHRTARSIDAAYARSRVAPGDVLLSIKGTTGRVGIVPEGFSGNISRDLARLRVKPGVSPRFIAHALRAPTTQRRLAGATVGTTRAEISIWVLRDFALAIPPYQEQEQIADALDAIDFRLATEAATCEKLKLLHRALAQRLFKVGSNGGGDGA